LPGAFMQSLIHQRCFNHSQREAVGRCVGCLQFYCRECVTEHDDRLLCAICLEKLAKPPLTQHRDFKGVARLAQCLLSMLLLWFFFYWAGECLLAIPTSFHDGTLWQINWLDTQ
jgi:hypothetical protein